MKKFIAFIEVDEEKLLQTRKEAGDGSPEHESLESAVESELDWVLQSGISVRKLTELKKEETSAWDFVTKWYPDYDHSENIARANDLACIIHDEIEKGSHAEDLFINECDENKQVAQEKYNEIHVEIYEEAIENFLKETGGN